MAEIIVTTREGENTVLPFTPSMSLMQTICDGGVDELAALCGGVCSCATCHVYIGDDFLDSLPVMSEDEDLLLEGVPHRKANSRLSCQIRLTPEHNGMHVTIAEDE
ncbi:2Fe-2S iron-sulfur cluster-binding protein [Halioxenophilus sp. WMMB6]|uniref:2Fe-2S iron-sulfur cluster-binding protein n=1 Tax=Halioxenophilus sp. WMMB6 TaxID=3073815 RepID=UPI00295E64E2|nr:2Fe-2S iron-sulfur cluster-binding protein [Halioxenophilus sp. WMMB6]